MLSYNRRCSNFRPCKAESENVIYRYKYKFHDCIKLLNTEVVVTRIPNERSQLNTQGSLSGYDISSKRFQIRSSMSLYSNSKSK